MRLVALAAALFGLGMAPVIAQVNRSLTGSGSLAAPQGATSPRAAALKAENAQLQENLLLLRATVQELTRSLAMANSEAEMFKRQSADYATQLEALGLAGIDRDPSKIEQRLLTAVREIRNLQKSNDEAKNQLIALSEAILNLLQASPGIDPAARAQIEAQLRQTNDFLGASPDAAPAQKVEATLTDGMVVGLKNELSLIVANLGAKQGVKVGMPFKIIRDGAIVGNAMVVEVRDRISGAIIQNLENEQNPVRMGDRLRVETRQ